MIECTTDELRSPLKFESLRKEQLDRWVESSPGDRRFIAVLPLEAAAAAVGEEI